MSEVPLQVAVNGEEQEVSLTEEELHGHHPTE